VKIGGDVVSNTDWILIAGFSTLTFLGLNLTSLVGQVLETLRRINEIVLDAELLRQDPNIDKSMLHRLWPRDIGKY
jgi:hypothetical protein